MVAYNFQSQFARGVESGNKPHTIRADRKRHARPGEAVQLYTGMRTKACRKLMDPDPVCVEVQPICIHMGTPRVTLGGRIIEGVALEKLARADGFGSAAEMQAWFGKTHGLPFQGWFIRWGGESCLV